MSLPEHLQSIVGTIPSAVVGGSSVAIRSSPLAVKSSTPVKYRLARRKDGTIVLQGCFQISSPHGCEIEWEDLPTVELDT